MRTAIPGFVGAALVAVGLSATTPAYASWGFTDWGMTPAQVVKASNGRAVKLAPPESQAQSSIDGNQVAKLSMPYKWGKFAFDAYFLFNGKDRLCRVTLYLKSGPMDGLRSALAGSYGRPEAVDPMPQVSGGVEKWHKGHDTVMLSVMLAWASVDYYPNSARANAKL